MRKRIACLIMAAVIFLTFNTAWAAEVSFWELRGKIFEESVLIKALLPKSKDMVFLSSMWDSCLMTISSIDAYFSMLGILNTIKKENLTEPAVKYLADWLGSMKTTNYLNINNLKAMALKPVEKNTRPRIKKMLDYYTALNSTIDAQLAKVAALRATAKKENVPVKRKT